MNATLTKQQVFSRKDLSLALVVTGIFLLAYVGYSYFSMYHEQRRLAQHGVVLELLGGDLRPEHFNRAAHQRDGEVGDADAPRLALAPQVRQRPQRRASEPPRARPPRPRAGARTVAEPAATAEPR